MRAFIVILFVLVPVAAQSQILVADSLQASDTTVSAWQDVTLPDTSWSFLAAIAGTANLKILLEMRMNDTIQSGYYRLDSLVATAGNASFYQINLRDALISLFFTDGASAAVNYLAQIKSYWQYRIKIITFASGNAGQIIIFRS